MERYMDVENRFLFADTLIQKGELVEAKEVLEEILNDEPDYGRAHNHLGWIFRAHYSDFERAEYHMRLSVKFAPQYPAGYLNYARLLMELNEWNKLEKVAAKAIEVRGIDKAYATYYMAVAIEMTVGPDEGFRYMKTARNFATDEETFNFISGEMRRVKRKMNTLSRIAFLF